jgi:hypothetical protein
MNTKIQEFLRAGGTYAELLSKYAIKAKRHPDHPSLVLLKYDQIGSPFGEEIVRECRGIIIDEASNWHIVSRAFDKFFNHGEGHAAPIDWATARVQEKIDGSLAVLYPYAGVWHVATSGTPDAGGDVNGMGVTFRELFWRVWDKRPLPPVDCGHCFAFELVGPLNRVVVQHAEERLVWLSARNLETQREARPEDVQRLIGLDWHFPTPVREFPLQSFDDIAASFATMSPLAQEGYVVVDAVFRRVKVKHPGYVALHHAKGGMSRRAFVEIARSGETSEVEVAFPEFGPYLTESRTRWTALIAEVEADFERLRYIGGQKEFALQAVKTRCSAALFAVRGKKAECVSSFLRGVRIETVMGLLGYRTDEEGIPAAREDVS